MGERTASPVRGRPRRSSRSSYVRAGICPPTKNDSALPFHGLARRGDVEAGAIVRPGGGLLLGIAHPPFRFLRLMVVRNSERPPTARLPGRSRRSGKNPPVGTVCALDRRGVHANGPIAKAGNQMLDAARPPLGHRYREASGLGRPCATASCARSTCGRRRARSRGGGRSISLLRQRSPGSRGDTVDALARRAKGGTRGRTLSNPLPEHEFTAHLRSRRIEGMRQHPSEGARSPNGVPPIVTPGRHTDRPIGDRRKCRRTRAPRGFVEK